MLLMTITFEFPKEAEKDQGILTCEQYGTLIYLS
jgi:hypothetical protein